VFDDEDDEDDDDESDEEDFDSRGPASDSAKEAVMRATNGRRVIKKNVVYDAPERWDWVVYRWPNIANGWAVGQVTALHIRPKEAVWEGQDVELSHKVTYYGEDVHESHALCECTYGSPKVGGWWMLSRV